MNACASGAPESSGERARRLARDLVEKLDVSTPFGPVLLPSAGHYTGIFAWDSAWHYFFLRELDTERAVAELETLFATAEGDGRVPHETRFAGPAPGGLMRRLALLLLASSFDENDRSLFVDPPVYAWAAADAVERGLVSGPRAEKLLARAAASLSWFRTHRTLAGLPYPYSELPLILHPLESGTDASPQFDEVYGGPARLAAAIVDLPRRLRRLGWNPEGALTGGIPAVFDITLISFYLLGVSALHRVARSLGGASARSAAGPGTHAPGLSGLPNPAEHSRLLDAFTNTFRDRASGLFRSAWLPGGRASAPSRSEHGLEVRPCRTLTLSGILPLLIPELAGSLESPRAADTIVRHLHPGGTFFAQALPRYTMPPSAPGREKLPRMLWRGPCSWMNMNYCAWLLLRGGSSARPAADAAELLARRALEAVERAGPHEYLHADGHSGGGAYPFSWNGLLLPMAGATGPDGP
jgi:hypothetical protein